MTLFMWLEFWFLKGKGFKKKGEYHETKHSFLKTLFISFPLILLFKKNIFILVDVLKSLFLHLALSLGLTFVNPFFCLTDKNK